MGYLRNYTITNAANPTNMLLSMLDDYVLLPIPASHMISGSVNMRSFMQARSAQWSKIGDYSYYGKVISADQPSLIIRTNFVGVTQAAGTQYGQILVSYHMEFQGVKAVLE
jgi:hypothetical protein